MGTVHTLWGRNGLDARIVSPDEAVALIAANGNVLFRRTPEEQAEIDGLKLRHISAEVRIQMITSGIDVAEAARVCGLTEDQVRGILEADLSRISVDEADAAFVTLTQAASRRMGM